MMETLLRGMQILYIKQIKYVSFAYWNLSGGPGGVRELGVEQRFNYLSVSDSTTSLMWMLFLRSLETLA